MSKLLGDPSDAAHAVDSARAELEEVQARGGNLTQNLAAHVRLAEAQKHLRFLRQVEATQAQGEKE